MSALSHPAAPARHEAKFVLPKIYTAQALAWLNHLCAPDPAYGENRVHSLYYDSLRMNALRQSEQGEYLKQKVRLRWYTDELEKEFSDKAYLEVKSKEGARSWKTRVPMALDVAALHREPAAAVRDLCLTDWLAPPAVPDLVAFAPVCVISYLRSRFVDMATGYRIALDSEICLSNWSSERPRGNRPGTARYSVLEVKGFAARVLPPPLHVLNRYVIKKSAFSKYAECMRLE
ncbi:MAG: VTC domain-containing protein [Lentisphaerae bacterium]|jgi:hypothetical protein|nr:VTC domain-containing protein [Lentisphaerota bacterium]